MRSLLFVKDKNPLSDEKNRLLFTFFLECEHIRLSLDFNVESIRLFHVERHLNWNTTSVVC